MVIFQHLMLILAENEVSITKVDDGLNYSCEVVIEKKDNTTSELFFVRMDYMFPTSNVTSVEKLCSY